MIPGFALLGSHLGDPDRKILTPAQIRTLTERVKNLPHPEEDRHLNREDLQLLGYGPQQAEQILDLLSQTDQLEAYLEEGIRNGCTLLTRADSRYPALVRRRLGGESPCCFFCKGNRELLNTPAVALVGSRDLYPLNRDFAREVGRQAAAHNLTLISGNARGADRTAQNACLEAGGRVISIVADELLGKHPEERMLFLSREDYDAPFSAPRALSRNRVIHSMGYMTLVAQCRNGSGGTWSGTVQNLRNGWSLVVGFRDGSEAMEELQNLGAYLLDTEDLINLTDIRNPQMDLFDL